MRSYGYLAVFTLCIAGAVALVSSARTAVFVGLLVQPTEKNLGSTTQGTSHHLEYTLTNRFHGPIYIKSLMPSCSCTKALADKSELAVGEIAKVSAVWNVHNARHMQSIVIGVSYVADGGQGDTALLTATADVSPDIELEPRKLRIGGEKDVQRELKYWSRAGTQYRILRVTANSDAVIARHDSEARTITVIVDRDKWRTKHAEQTELTIETDSPNEKCIYYPIYIPAGAGEAKSD